MSKSIIRKRLVPSGHFRWLATKFLSPSEQERVGVLPGSEVAADTGMRIVKERSAPATVAPGTNQVVTFGMQEDAPSCPDCGSIMVRNGSCYKCINCGTQLGCS